MSKLKSAVVKPPQQRPKRKRTKKLHKNLLEQLEFYFSEANLRHDPFLKEKTGEMGTDYVPLRLLLSFPMMQELSADRKNVISAARDSRIIELSQDKNSIRRRQPVPRPPHNLDQSTLYIENLPPDTTIDWLKEVCRKIGTVRHVSVPRYKKSGNVKGFAFVEFSSPEEVSRACRVLKDPPKNFFPNRTEKYLLRIKRQKMREDDVEEDYSETSPIAHFKTPDVLHSGASSTLNKSLDPALDIDYIGQESGTSAPLSETKRKRRRSQRLSESQEISPAEAGSASHTPAKKMKSLPMRLSYNKTDTPMNKPCQHGDSTISPTVTRKNKRKVLFDDEEIDEPPTRIKNSKFTVNAKNTAANMPEKYCPIKTQKTNSTDNKSPEKTDTNALEMKIDSKCAKKDMNGNISVKEEPVPSTSDSVNADVMTHDQELPHDDPKDNISPLQDTNGVIILAKERPTILVKSSTNQSETAHQDEGSTKSSKRKRSISEPPCVFENNNAPKLQKIQESSGAAGELCGDSRIMTNQPSATVNFDIDAIIAQGRQQAKSSDSHPQLSRRKSLQSVVAMPKAAKKPRQRSKKQKKRAKTRQTAPKLNVMSKVDWVEYKREYKRLQKENMSRLKKTLKAGKNAGSVFIKKHLDVLKDGGVSDDSSSSDSGTDDDSAKSTRKESKNKELGKRGAPTFTPGVIASISALNTSEENEKLALPSIAEIKSLLGKYGRGVAYVDAKTGHDCGYVRFHDGDSAQRAIMEEKTLALCLLTGELEERYWDKLLAARAQKFAKERRSIRGRTKILVRAERCVEKAKRRHIRFDNDFSM